MLVTNILSFSHNVFNPIKDKIFILANSVLSSANAFNLDQSNILLFGKELTFPKQALNFTCLHYKSFENTVGQGKIARNEQFLLFPVFSTCLENFLPFQLNLKLSTAISFRLEESKIFCLGKG